MSWIIKNKNDSLTHAGIGSHKYIDKYRDRKGNWQYIYEDDGVRTATSKQAEAVLATRQRRDNIRDAAVASVSNFGRTVSNTAKKLGDMAKASSDKRNAEEARRQAVFKSVSDKAGTSLTGVVNKYLEGREAAAPKIEERKRAEAERYAREGRTANDIALKRRMEAQQKWFNENVANRYESDLYNTPVDSGKNSAKLSTASSAHVRPAGSKLSYKDNMKKIETSIKDSAREEASKTVNNITKQLNARKNATPFRGGDDRGYKLDQQRKAEEHARQVAEAERRNKPTGIPANATKYERNYDKELSYNNARTRGEPSLWATREANGDEYYSRAQRLPENSKKRKKLIERANATWIGSRTY